MAQSAGSTMKGVATFSLISLNVIFWVPILMVVALARFLLPLAGWRRATSRVMTWLAESWITCNRGIFSLMRVLEIDVRGLEGLKPDEWYLVVSNHRSWVDILVLQMVLNHRIPFLKFFLKQQLIWVPFLGVAWWALDFPFMRRHSAEYLVKHPEARNDDLTATRKACERFALIPTSVMNFVEGTRFSEAKRARSKSPYRHLLRPRAGGISFVLSAMGGMLHAMVDVTIAYRETNPTLWDLCCGRLQKVRVEITRRPIDRWTTEGDYANDPEFRGRFKRWLGGIWEEKDARLDVMMNAPAD